MEKTINTLDVLTTVNRSVANANHFLVESPADRFNRTLLDIIQKEIENAKMSALHWKYMNPGTHEYTYVGYFPITIYNELSEDFLIQLENTTGVSIYAVSESKATIKIVLHF